MEEIYLNITPTGNHPVCHVSQYDVGRQIKVNLFDDTIAYVLQSGDSLTLSILKPDGAKISAELDVVVGTTYSYIETAEEMCDIIGKNVCELRLKNGNKNIGTLNFFIMVEEAIADAEPLPTYDDFVLFANGKWNEIPNYDVTLSESGMEYMQIIDGILHFTNVTGFSIFAKDGHPFMVVVAMENVDFEAESDYFYMQSGRCVRGADARLCQISGTGRLSYSKFNGEYKFDGGVKLQWITDYYDFSEEQALFISGNNICIKQICVFPITNGYTVKTSEN